MSHHIVYEIAAVKLPPGCFDRYGHDETFIILWLSGDNNVYENATGRRARDWRVRTVGQHYEVIRNTCVDAGECEGGMLKLSGKKTTPEMFIRATRAALDAALPIDLLPNTSMRIYGRINIGKKEIAERPETAAFVAKVQANFPMHDAVTRWGNLPALQTEDINLLEPVNCNKLRDLATGGAEHLRGMLAVSFSNVLSAANEFTRAKYERDHLKLQKEMALA